jgi:uncharacterized protein
MTGRPARVDAARFGPWALITGASSGIGKGFAEQIAASKINVVLAARRLSALNELGQGLADRHGIQFRAIQVDLAAPDFMATVVGQTQDLDIGLVVSNAGDMVMGEFVTSPFRLLASDARLNVDAHLALAHHFGQRLAGRGRGGLLLVSSTAGMQGVPYTASYAAAKAYVFTLGEGIHHELSPQGINVTVVLPGATATPMLSRFGADKTRMRRFAMPVDACVKDALKALQANRAVRVSGRMNRLMMAMMPRPVRTRLLGGFSKSMAGRAPAADPAVPAAGGR